MQFKVRTSTENLNLKRLIPGAVPYPTGTAFTLWAPNAPEVILHLYDRGERELGRVRLPEQRGGWWTGFVEEVSPGMLYAYEVPGEEDPQEGLYFKTGRLLADPYARALSRPLIWDRDLYERHSQHFMPKAVVPEIAESFEWQGTVKPGHRRRDLIIYETNVKGFSVMNPEIPAAIRGTYLGMAHPSSIRHLKRLGITAVQLNPVAFSMSEPELVARGLCNYWGYNPVCFMAPDPRFASEPLNSETEFKTMVRELHRAGIAVLLDVVFNHTAEGGNSGPVLSMKGLDNRGYYAFERRDGRDDYLSYVNVSGCGNSYCSDALASFRLVADALIHWYRDLRVDGFRFDLAVTVNREKDEHGGFLFHKNSAFMKACFALPELTGAILIAEPWDCAPDGYRLGQFAEGWSEQNDRFRDEVRRFWRGDPGTLGDFATRLMGSRDIFYTRRRSINASVNYVTYHDGFTLEDLVSYERKRNEQNGYDNADGAGENFSSNCGVEGPTNDPEILRIRRRRKRNFMATLFLSQGIPHFLGGDEFSRTQQGNNNAFCQDNEVSYLKWERDPENEAFTDYIAYLISLRKSSGMLKQLCLSDEVGGDPNLRFEARWFRHDGMEMSPEDWNDPNNRSFLLNLVDLKHELDQWCILVNGGTRDLSFALPGCTGSRHWGVLFDSSSDRGRVSGAAAEPGDFVTCHACSMALLRQMDASTDDMSDRPLRHGNRR